MKLKTIFQDTILPWAGLLASVTFVALLTVQS
jgi:hypothetical protein